MISFTIGNAIYPNRSTTYLKRAHTNLRLHPNHLVTPYWSPGNRVVDGDGMPVRAAEAIDEGAVAMLGIAPPRSRWLKFLFDHGRLGACWPPSPVG